MWTALCERYGEQICVIGHRSGFVEAAAMIGIPVFYLNNERESMKTAEGKENRLLFDASAVSVPENDRLRELSDVMNTLIPVEILDKVVEKKPKSTESTEILRMRTGLKWELKAAIFMYMCCLRDEGSPAWTERVQLMHEVKGRAWLKERFDFAKDK